MKQSCHLKYLQVNHVVLCLSLIVLSFHAAALPIRPYKLTCEYLKHPLGIETRQPRFSWLIDSSQRNLFQSAYELVIGTREKEVERSKGNMWQSGKINSDQNILIEYKGAPLRSATRYFWRVRVYDQNGKVSQWSKTSWFETALSDSEWTARWIGDGSSEPLKDEDYYAEDRMPLFRHSFLLHGKISSARLYITGLGYYEARINGKLVDSIALDPGFTTYKKQVLYSVFDLQPLLKNGENTIAVMLGNGWWNPLPFKFFGRWDLRNYQQTGRPCLKAEVWLNYSDGHVEKIVTDENWLTAPGPVTHNNVYLGETYDARLEQKNWVLGQIDSSQWKHAVRVQGPSGVLTVQMQPPIRITRQLKPVRLTETGRDTFIVDMGQNFAGVARIRLQGKKGTRISIRYGEDLFADGRLNVLTTAATQIKKGGIKGGPGAPETAWQEDHYILKGEGVEEWAPRFTFHGFRYLEITGWPGQPNLDDITALRMNTDLEQTGTFICSDEDLNHLHEVTQWTFLSNVFSIQSDCPGREKMGYGGDMVATADAFLYNYDMIHFYGKSVRDFANEQRNEGGITEIAPFTGIADRGYGDDSGPLGWELAFPFLQKQLYEFYGDKRIIENNYPAFKKQMKFLEDHSYEGLYHWDISDHEAVDTKPEAFTASAFYYHHARLAEEFAGILGKKDDSIHFNQLANNIRSAIIRKYLVPTTGRFDNATQSAQVFALWYDLSPEKELSWQVLLDEIKRHKEHLATGIFSTRMMLDLFRKRNEQELAWKIVTQPDYPGWLNMIHHGATTLWETWGDPGTVYSENHPMFGSVDEWFYRSLLGINAASPGFETIQIKPQPPRALSWARGSYESVRGKIVSEWEKTSNGFLLHVVIPANTKAIIYLPSQKNSLISEGNKSMQALRYEEGYSVFETGSGDYFFQVRNQ
ncbi:MAG: family 78 glycoside hydrolase catalytic domain [Flavisolibacter sp.]